MFLPLRDTPNEGGTPVVNYLLIGINVAVFLLVSVPLMGTAPELTDPALRDYLAAGGGLNSVSAYDLFVFEYGFRPAAPSLQTLGASMFLHGGPMHLAGNMLFLWIYGDNVEAWLGRAGYLVAYLLCGVAATAFHAAFDLSSVIPMIGASGAISGVLGFYFVFFPKNKVSVLLVLFPFFYNVVLLPARLVLGAYLVLDNLLPILFSGGAGSVAHGAHIGGFIGGLGAAYALVGLGLRRRRGGAVIDLESRRPRVREEPGRAPDPTSGSAPWRRPGGDPEGGDVRRRIGRLVKGGQFAEAAQVYFASPEVPANEPAHDDALKLGHWLSTSGHPTAALLVFERLLRQEPSPTVAAWAHLGAGIVQFRALERPSAGYRHLLDAARLDAAGPAGAQARALIAEIDSSV